MQAVLEINGLSKKYGAVQALDDLTLSVPKGSVYGILGPNGSGKTTTLSIILGVIHANSGSYSWFGEPPNDDHRKRIGPILEKPNFLPNLNAEKNLRMVAEIKGRGVDRIDEVLKKTGLYERKKTAFKTYSLGMKQRLALAAALLSNPEVLVLDEPTNGLDPQGIVDVRELIVDLSREGKTVILASHILDEVEKVCTHVAILKLGRLRKEGEVTAHLADSFTIQIGADNPDNLGAVLHEIPRISSLERTGEYWSGLVSSDFNLAELNKMLVEKGVPPNHLMKVKPSLESAYLTATGA